MKRLFASEEGEAAFRLGLDPAVRFGEGFCPLETERREGKFLRSFRKVARYAELRLKPEANATMQLRLGGVVLRTATRGAPVLRFMVQGRYVRSFTMSGEWFDETLTISGDVLRGLEWVNVAIETSTWGAFDFGIDCRTNGSEIHRVDWGRADEAR